MKFVYPCERYIQAPSLAPRGASGLKSLHPGRGAARRPGLAPRGASGLKYRRRPHLVHPLRSRPARGEWIEMMSVLCPVQIRMSRPARGEWIEIIIIIKQDNDGKSRPARGEWIEIGSDENGKYKGGGLAPRGASGLKLRQVQADQHPGRGLAPRGASGLKCHLPLLLCRLFRVSPREGRVD